MQLLAGLERLLARVGKRVLHVEQGVGVVTVEVSSTVRAAPCTVCRRWSDRVHGGFVRYLAERPVLDQRLVLAVEMRRFKCSDVGCARRTFAESITSLAGRHQRRTHSQSRALQALGHALGGEAAARLAAALGLCTSADTVLRQLRRTDIRRRRYKPRIVGIDDWAIARGHNYGTIIVDLERREPIEVLVGREASAVTQWLRRNPSIEIVARDRAGAYSEAVNIALPHAQQVSDRWHLLSNLRDNVERMLQRMGSQMREAARRVVVTEPTHGRQGRREGPRLAWWQRLSDDRRSIRLALYDSVTKLHTQGRTMKSIAGELDISYQTVRKFVHTGSFPERARKARGHTPLDAHLQYIEERIAQGSRNPLMIWREVRQRGYSGSRASVKACVVRLLFPQGKPALVDSEPTARTMPCPSARRAFGWLVGWRKLAVEEPKNANHERFVQALCDIEPVVAQVRSLSRQFLGIMHRRRPSEFDRWLTQLSRCEAPEMKSFARSLQADLPAVRAAFQLSWSNGQTEGHVNRLKFLKRQMYGRGSVELLRLRVLRPT
ncbi:ISL3 family transposase [Pseudorhodoferax soli]|uniref:Transposase n=1 Tax=Pseudorhodoferax soli TaxID=545864 RepID=A0A368X751_9BURK|nr:ISL3 family transposase [Pseudorhodoferax soli]RCW63635.1 transposase [Pseudorhodoferax soli]